MAKKTQQQLFGGPWTQDKLERLQKYLAAYTKIFKRNPRASYFEISYIDAFAGTGYMATPEVPAGYFFPELLEGVEEYQKGSVRRALEVEPSFDHYIFVERDKKCFQELANITKEFADRDIRLSNEDANVFLQRWCKTLDTRRNRAVVFLDPFGANVSWKTIQAIASTQAIDVWILFPLLINRMLDRDQKPREAWAKRLTDIFGTPEWEREFYTTQKLTGLFDFAENTELINKTADTDKIANFFLKRLKNIFPAVATPRVLLNSRGAPLYLLCFAAGNLRGADTALRIANHILGK